MRYDPGILGLGHDTIFNSGGSSARGPGLLSIGTGETQWAGGEFSFIAHTVGCCACGEIHDAATLAAKTLLAQGEGSSPIAAATAGPIFAGDIPGDTSSTATIAIGGTVVDTIEVSGDQDWFKVTLVAGTRYQITLTGSGDNPLADPYLEIMDASGNQVKFDDDSGPGLNSSAFFVPTTTGTYFINAHGWIDADNGGVTSTGQYTLTLQEAPPLEEYSFDQIATFLTSGYWTQRAWTDLSIDVNLTALSAAQQTLARAALATWASITPLVFTEVQTGGQIVFTSDDPAEEGSQDAHASSTISNGTITHSDVNISDNWFGGDTTLDSYTFQTYLHEIGHALGLGHAGPYNSTAVYGQDNIYTNDNWSHTVMSYFDQLEAGWGNYRFALGPQIADILAIQLLYGANPNGTRAGNTVYGFNSTETDINDWSQFVVVQAEGTYLRPPSYAIYDTGGIDTIDLSGFSRDQELNLNPETFSSLGDRPSNADPTYTNIVSIARGTIIENAIGGSGNDTIIGNSAFNNLSGGAGQDTLYGGAGNDRLYGQDDNDTLYGGEGADIVDGGNGNDTLYGEAAPDYLAGGAGNDWMSGGDANDRMYGGTGTDSMYGGANNDTMHGEDGNDRMYGQDHNDTMYGGEGADIVDGGNGDDTMYGEAAPDYMAGGAGNDWMSGGDANDRMYGGTGVDSMYGGAHNDTMYGEDGNDRMYGQDHNDTMYGGEGADIVEGGNGDDTMYGEAAPDYMAGGSGDDWMSGGDANDRMYGGTGIDSMYGGADNDMMYGEDGNDRMYGQDHNDTMYGGEGADIIDGGNGNDTMYGDAAPDYMAGGAGDDWMSGGDAGDRMYGGTGFDSMYGGAHNDTMYGEDGNDRMYGQDHNDTMYGGDGADIVDGGNGDDTMYGEAAPDYMAGGAGNDWMSGGDANDRMYGGDGNDTMYGDANNDTMDGEAGIDWIDGGSGVNTLTGGADADVFVMANFESSTSNQVTDFVQGEDVCRLIGSGITSFAQLQAAMTTVGAAHTLITFSSGAQLQIDNILPNQFTSADFTLLTSAEPQTDKPVVQDVISPLMVNDAGFDHFDFSGLDAGMPRASMASHTMSDFFSRSAEPAIATADLSDWHFMPAEHHLDLAHADAVDALFHSTDWYAA